MQRKTRSKGSSGLKSRASSKNRDARGSQKPLTSFFSNKSVRESVNPHNGEYGNLPVGITSSTGQEKDSLYYANISSVKEACFNGNAHQPQNSDTLSSTNIPAPKKKVFSIFEKRHNTTSTVIPVPSSIVTSMSTPSPLSPIIPGALSTFQPSSQEYTVRRTHCPAGSQNAPIEVLDASPDTSPSRMKANPSNLFPLFTSQPKTNSTSFSSGDKLDISVRQLLPVPLPNAENQHALGQQTVFPISVALDVAKRKPPHVNPTHPWTDLPPLCGYSSHLFQNDDFHPIPTCTSFDSEDIELYLSAVSAAHLSHPAIKRFEDHYGGTPFSVTPNNEAWTERWRPRRAEEVLGNEGHACYLRAWLQSLELHMQQSTPESSTSFFRKRPKVIRAVERGRAAKRRKTSDWEQSSLQDWLTDGSEEEVVVDFDDEDDDFQLPQSSPIKRRQRAEELLTQPTHLSSQFDFASGLTNTILLSGPPGSGKTAAIYACAEELEWQVFEVYPGIGRRSGSNIATLVGDVAKNHTIPKISSSLLHATYTPTAATSAAPAFTQGGADGCDKTNSTHESVDEHSIAQSIILFEEVDILFNEDVNFWPSVVKLIRESRRPVVLTCNDPTIIPLEDLPIQAHLTFEACPKPLAQAYLKCLLLAEGHMLNNNNIATIYQTSFKGLREDYPDQPWHPLPSESEPVSDLRRAINHMQLWCSGKAKIGDVVKRATDERSLRRTAATIGDWFLPEPHFEYENDTHSERLGHLVELFDLDRLLRLAENVSYCDSELSTGSGFGSETDTLRDRRSEEDVEMGYECLTMDQPSRLLTLAPYNKEDEIFQTSLMAARQRFEAVGTGQRARSSIKLATGDAGFDSMALFQARAKYQRPLVGILDKVLPVDRPLLLLLPHPALHLDYVPCLRHVVREEQDADVRVEGSDAAPRRARRSGRLGRRGDVDEKRCLLGFGLDEETFLRESRLIPSSSLSDHVQSDIL